MHRYYFLSDTIPVQELTFGYEVLSTNTDYQNNYSIIPLEFNDYLKSMFYFHQMFLTF